MLAAHDTTPAKPYAIAKRKTADDRTVVLWSTGAVTGALGFPLAGVPVARPKTADALARELTAGWLMMGEVELYDGDELGTLHEACRHVAARGGTPGDVRARANRTMLPSLRWSIVSADRDGKPTERVAMLPRLRWPGLAVFDFCGSVGSSRGRYQVWRHSDGTAYPTGCDFGTLADLWVYLLSVSA